MRYFPTLSSLKLFKGYEVFLVRIVVALCAKICSPTISLVLISNQTRWKLELDTSEKHIVACHDPRETLYLCHETGDTKKSDIRRERVQV